MSQLIQINDISIEQILYKGQPVVTFEQIARVHGIPVQNVQKSFRRNQAQFEEGKHVIRLDYDAVTQLVPGVLVSPNGLLLFTEKGYLRLTKPMKDAKSWQVQDRMVDEYFALRDAVFSPTDLPFHNPTTKMLIESLIRLDAFEAEQAAQRDALVVMQRETIKTQELALLALRGQLWMTIRHYVFLHDLQSQLPESAQSSYGKWLSKLCLEQNIPFDKITPGDRKWETEYAYPVQIIHDTLEGWLKRREEEPLGMN